MKILTQEQFKKKKTSDTIFVLGSGWSINNVTDDEWNIIKKHNSAGFNWSCKHSFEPTFFLIREQANLPQRKHKGETIKTLIKRVNRYTQTACIICDVRKHTPRAYNYGGDKRITAQCIVVRDNNNRKHSRKPHKYFKLDPFKHGLIHGRCTMYNILHLVTYLQYKQVVFVGVDLRDSRYFWLDKKDTRHTLVKKGKKHDGKHPITSDMMRLIKRCRKLPFDMYVSYKKSLLKRRIPYKSIQEFS
ncbi:hypothetical protein LCGC14_1046170 [marine sediment metagenome]|uniref:Uncharacterized protein n=1 Tax=marine sediment metagenome TaxID=412755 RepID=A0A0F9Q8D0_9ZZZZ